MSAGPTKLNFYCTGSGTPTVVFDAGWEDWSPSWVLIQPQFFRGLPMKEWSPELNAVVLHIANTRVALYDASISEMHGSVRRWRSCSRARTRTIPMPSWQR